MAEQQVRAEHSVKSVPPQDLVYGINDKPPILQAIFAALQHMLAMFVGIITPPLIIGSALKLPAADIQYIVSLSLIMSGVGTLIQTKRLGRVGCGLLAVQGTSFNFVSPIIVAGLALQHAGVDTQTMLGTLFGTLFISALVMVLVSRCLHWLRRVITPLVTGIIVLLIGLTLIKEGVVSMGGGYGAMQDGSFGSLTNLGLSALVFLIIVICNLVNCSFLRLSAIVIAMVIGYLSAWWLGVVHYQAPAHESLFTLPAFLPYGFHFSFALFIPLAIIAIVTCFEAIGDITATSDISREPVDGPLYMRRIGGGVLASGLNSALAALTGTFPLSNFAQNNGVIQLTGVASRRVGIIAALMLILLGFLPSVAFLIQNIPQPVLGGATIIMFGTIAAAGIRIIAKQELDRRALLILTVSLGLGLGVSQVPNLLVHLPPLIRSVLSFGVATGGIAAMLLNLILFPGSKSAVKRKQAVITLPKWRHHDDHV
nr:uracil-xanthine permease family protein [Dongshaea marina]